jgi:hypothetical protein
MGNESRQVMMQKNVQHATLTSTKKFRAPAAAKKKRDTVVITDVILAIRSFKKALALIPLGMKCL